MSSRRSVFPALRWAPYARPPRRAVVAESSVNGPEGSEWGLARGRRPAGESCSRGGPRGHQVPGGWALVSPRASAGCEVRLPPGRPTGWPLDLTRPAGGPAQRRAPGGRAHAPAPRQPQHSRPRFLLRKAEGRLGPTLGRWALGQWRRLAPPSARGAVGIPRPCVQWAFLERPLRARQAVCGLPLPGGGTVRFRGVGGRQAWARGG